MKLCCFADNTGVFRDIKKRGKRKVLELDPAGRKIVEVPAPAPSCYRLVGHSIRCKQAQPEILHSPLAWS